MSDKLRLCTLSFAASLLLGMASQLMAYGFDECYYLQWGYDYSEPYYRSADPSATDQSTSDQATADQSIADPAQLDTRADTADEAAMTPRDGYGDGYDTGIVNGYGYGGYGNAYLWYCQARPHGAKTWDIFIRERFHSYKPNRLDARDQSLFRCERYTGRCEARCALAPRVCAPHFWP